MKWLDLRFFNNGDDAFVAARLAEVMNSGVKVLPMVGHIMAALDHTPLDQVKVVIVGQDPYPTDGHAMGLAFSVDPTVRPLPKSLRNIYQELEEDVGVVREDGDLRDWAKQGVLLMNTTLTVVEGKPGSHATIGWHLLTDEIIETLNETQENLVFILWGKHAQSICKNVDRDKHLIIESAHPSPLSAHRGFFGSKPFSKTNEYLVKHNKKPINW